MEEDHQEIEATQTGEGISRTGVAREVETAAVIHQDGKGRRSKELSGQQEQCQREEDTQMEQPSLVVTKQREANQKIASVETSKRVGNAQSKENVDGGKDLPSNEKAKASKEEAGKSNEKAKASKEEAGKPDEKAKASMEEAGKPDEKAKASLEEAGKSDEKAKASMEEAEKCAKPEETVKSREKTTANMTEIPDFTRRNKKNFKEIFNACVLDGCSLLMIAVMMVSCASGFYMLIAATRKATIENLEIIMEFNVTSDVTVTNSTTTSELAKHTKVPFDGTKFMTQQTSPFGKALATSSKAVYPTISESFVSEQHSTNVSTEDGVSPEFLSLPENSSNVLTIGSSRFPNVPTKPNDTTDEGYQARG